ncbi:spore germination protein KC [Paenibacillus cellulosilyticus]|uniref:Spore germination protein KC n=1 Tax=Paenibacillus cellulosilyticus TaxID=375489 RepID=A0A2V2YND3_9BACL|nr:Ger(x)C family spore germination protein [Paenibacillus cellulosilyticus]PWV95906.1 spore germination protein KC [Paenibacillus cellulosilyticus]QKS47773.1 Ger(x)C family spore germination protein [Paenibacillus cellulosilyticus]
MRTWANRFLCIVLALSLTLTLTGCWDRRELNEIAISVGLGIDKVGDRYRVTVQVVQPAEVAASKGSAGYSTPVTTYRASGATIFEAIRKMTTISPRKIYASHLRVVVIGEELAREGIADALDLISRDYELRMDFYVLIAKDTNAEDLLELLTPLDKIPASKIFNSIQVSEKAWAPVSAVTLDMFIRDYESKGNNPVLSGIKATGNEEKGKQKSNVEKLQPDARLRNNGLAVFRMDKLIGWMSQEQSKGYNYIINRVKSTVGHVPCPSGDGNVALEIIRSKSKMRTEIRNGKPHLTVDLRVEENVGEVMCKMDITQEGVIDSLEHEAEQSLKDIVEQTIEAGQKTFKCDFFGFGNALHRSNLKAWKQMENDWDEHFVEASVTVTVKVDIKRTGTIDNSFTHDG